MVTGAALPVSDAGHSPDVPRSFMVCLPNCRLSRTVKAAIGSVKGAQARSNSAFDALEEPGATVPDPLPFRPARPGVGVAASVPQGLAADDRVNTDRQGRCGLGLEAMHRRNCR